MMMMIPKWIFLFRTLLCALACNMCHERLVYPTVPHAFAIHDFAPSPAALKAPTSSTRDGLNCDCKWFSRQKLQHRSLPGVASLSNLALAVLMMMMELWTIVVLGYLSKVPRGKSRVNHATGYRF
jgi:hypothetical protein